MWEPFFQPAATPARESIPPAAAWGEGSTADELLPPNTVPNYPEETASMAFFRRLLNRKTGRPPESFAVTGATGTVAGKEAAVQLIKEGLPFGRPS